MAKIVDPDQLTQNTEVTFTPSTKKITLSVAGNLDDNAPGKSSGVAHQALYSFGKEEWLTDATLQKARFPWLAIFEAKFDWINDWQPNDAQTVDLIRDAGLRIVLLDDEYAAILSLLSIDAPSTDLAYYWQTASWTATTNDFDKTGELNEPILIWDGSTDYRDFLKVALRVGGKTYGYGDLLTDQDLSALTYQAYRLPLANIPDTKIDETDGNIDTLTPYTNMQLNFIKGALFETAAAQSYSIGDVVQDGVGRWAYCTTAGTVTTPGGAYASFGGTSVWEAFAGEQLIGTNYYAFNRIIDLSTGTATAQEIYNWAMRSLRKTVDINDDTLGSPNQDAWGTINGKVAMELFDYVGSTLRTKLGVLIRDFDPNDTNSIEFSDITVDGGGLNGDEIPVTSTVRKYLFVSAGNIVFSDNLDVESDVDTIYKMFFQYSTRDTNTDVAMTAASGDTGTITSTLIDLTTHFSNGDYLAISGFTTNEVNNGLYQVNGVPTAGTLPVRKINGETLIDETAGDTVNLDADPFDTPDAIITQDNSTADITGQITALSIPFDFDYDGNVQGGRTAGVDAPVAIIAQGKGGAQWIYGLFTITEATGLNFPVNAADERVYLNP